MRNITNKTKLKKPIALFRAIIQRKRDVLYYLIIIIIILASFLKKKKIIKYRYILACLK